MTELSDELLVAYVDGQLAQKQAGAVEKVLAHDDVIARRVAALKKAHRSLEAAFEAILAGEEAKAVSHPIPPSPGLLIPWDTLVRGGLAAAGIVVAIGLFIAGYGWPAGPSEHLASGSSDTEYVGSLPDDWREDVARAQALLSRASLEIGLDSQGDRDFIALRLGRAIGAPLALPDLEGYRFARAQILRSGGEPLAQLLYLGATGAPLALYVKKGGADAAPAAKRYGGLSGVAWSQGGVAYLLAGDGDEAALLDLAETIRKGSDVRSPLGASTRAPQRSRGQRRSASRRFIPHPSRHATCTGFAAQDRRGKPSPSRERGSSCQAYVPSPSPRRLPARSRSACCIETPPSNGFASAKAGKPGSSRASLPP